MIDYFEQIRDVRNFESDNLLILDPWLAEDARKRHGFLINCTKKIIRKEKLKNATRRGGSRRICS